METDAPKFSRLRRPDAPKSPCSIWPMRPFKGQAWSHRPICDRYLRVHDGFGVPVPFPMRPFHGAV